MPEAPISIIPRPATITPHHGSFALTASTRIQATPALRTLAEQLRDALRPASGSPLPIVGRANGSRITLGLEPRLAALGDEGYRLSVRAREVRLDARRAAGIARGIQTLLQLLPPQIFRRARVPDVAWRMPAVVIEDRPRFGWRGSHVDVARHFLPKDTILKHLDLLALHKFNVFHWHLTDDQGWRIEIKRYPKLTEVGAWRTDSQLGPPTRDPGARRYAGKPHGGFYTQDDVREVVRYAAERFITVLPEIEMPGHARAAIAAYPELGNGGRPLEVATWWGVFDGLFAVDEPVFTFLEHVLEEVLELFPSRFIHIGGDEVPKKEWKESPAAQARMRKLGLSDEDELQSWFIKRMDTWLAKRGRRLVGWDEILDGGLAPGATVMSWRGENGGVTAAKAGHDVVMAPQKPTYFDHRQSQDSREPVGIGGLNRLADVYGYEPVPRELSDSEARHVLGAQGQLWTEYVPDPRHAEYMMWPRLVALSEVLWSPRETRDLEDFQRRLGIHLERLRILDVNFRPPGND